MYAVFMALSISHLSANDTLNQLDNHLLEIEGREYRELVSKIKIFISKIEHLKDFNEKYEEMISVCLSTQLAVELDFLKLKLEKAIEEYEDNKVSIRKTLYKSSNVDEIKECLNTLDNLEKQRSLVNACLECMDNLKNTYCNILVKYE